MAEQPGDASCRCIAAMDTPRRPHDGVASTLPAPEPESGGRAAARAFRPAARAPALVDVVMPVRNVERTLEAALGSIQAQSVRDIRILVVDDGSSDGTAAILARLAANDARLTRLDCGGSGIVDALNAGLAACTAEFVARHDGDDLAFPDRFARQLAWLAARPDCVAVSGAVRQIDAAGRPVGKVLHLAAPERADPHACPQREPYLMHPFLMMRRDAVRRVGGYRHVFHAEDTDLYWRLQEIGELCNMPDVLGLYRLHAQGVTGASLLNGRISAVNSQRSGLSALRRRSLREDLCFPKAMLEEYRAAGSLAAMLHIGGRGLRPEEASILAAAACAKLLEAASYRAFELDLEDCRFIHDTLSASLATLPEPSRAGCTRMLTGTAARLLATGRVNAARRLVSPRLWPLVAARLALRSLAPAALRRRLREAAGRPGFVK